ncbi:MAG: PAS domain S-box protein [Cytophagaceae bacterium]
MTFDEENVYIHELIDDISFPVIISDTTLSISLYNKAAEISFPGLNELRSQSINKLIGNSNFYSTDNISEFLNKEHQGIIFFNSLQKAANIVVSVFDTGSFKGFIFKMKPFVESAEDVSYKHLFNNVQEGIFIFDNVGKIIDTNPAASEIYNISKTELLKRHVFDLFPHKTEKETRLIWDEFLKTGSLAGLYKYKIGDKSTYIEFKTNKDFIPGFHLAVFSDVTSHKITERALKNSEANLKAVFNNNNQSLFLVDLEGKVITLNSKAKETSLFYRGESGALREGDSIFKDAGPDVFKGISPLFEKVKGGEVVQLEINAFWINPNLWLEIYANPVFDAYGKVESICLSSNDISYRKKSELTLKESEARFRSLVQNSSDIVLIISQEGKIIYASASLENITGYQEHQIVGQSFADYLFPEDLNRFDSSVKKVSRNVGLLLTVEFRLKHSEGHFFFLEATLNNQFDNKHIEGIVLNARDITLKKAQEENLLLLERAIDSSTNGIIISDPNIPDNPIIYANKAFENITGYSYHEIMGKNCRMLQGKDREQPELEKLRISLALNKSVNVVLRNYKKDGKLFFNDLNISPVFNKEGQLLNYIGVLNDITDRKIAEESLLAISQGVSGKDFYLSLARHLAIILEGDMIMISELENKVFKTKVLYKDGALVSPVQYPADDNSGCTIQDGKLWYYEDIKDRFPKDKFIQENNFSVSMGIPLTNSSGERIGIMCILNRQRFRNHSLVESLLNIFSVRVAAELEREVNLNALKSSEQKFRNLAENSPDFIYILDLAPRKVIYFNKTRFLGYPSKEFEESEAWFNIVHPNDRKRVINHWNNFLKDNVNRTSYSEYRILNSKGYYEWVVNRHVLLENVEGREKVVLLNLTVITERKMAEEHLRESEARLLALVENTSDLIWSINENYVLTTLNSAFKVFFEINYKHSLKVGDNLFDILPESIKEEWLQMHEKALQGERFSTEFISYQDHNPRSYEISYNPVYSDIGIVRGVSVFARDITQRKITENAIIRTNFELDSFVYRASHDLRAPLRSMLGLINLIKVEKQEKQRNNYLSLIDKSIDKLDNFISDLTNFSRNSRLEVTPAKIDFKKVFEEVKDNLKFMDNANAVYMELTINGDEEFYSDPMRISIIFQNLLSNAIKYQNRYIDDSFCKVHVHITDKFSIIEFSDNGIGIREEYHSKVFDMFFRASHDSYGSGLGLYITRQVVEKLNGVISVYSQLGKGTRFEVRLPNLLS